MIVFFWRNSVLIVFPLSFDKMHQDWRVELRCICLGFCITSACHQKLCNSFSIIHKCCSQNSDQHLYSNSTLQSASWILGDFFLFPLLSTDNVSRNNNVRCCTQLPVMMITIEILGHYGVTWEFFHSLKRSMEFLKLVKLIYIPFSFSEWYNGVGEGEGRRTCPSLEMFKWKQSSWQEMYNWWLYHGSYNSDLLTHIFVHLHFSVW